MDLFGKKLIREYQAKIKNLESKINILEKENDIPERKIKGDRVCDGYCKHCKNSIKTKTEHYGYGQQYTTETYCCALDCKCKDFQKAE